MRISITLADVNRLYIETAPLIYFVEENPEYVERMEAVLAFVESTSIETVSSVITLTEVLSHPLRLRQTDYEQAYRDILTQSQDFRLLPVTVETADRAAYLRAEYNLRTPDALHIATAIQARCDAFLTNDRGILRVLELQVLLLDNLEIDPPDSSTEQE